MLTERIERMRAHVNALNDAGPRRTSFYPLAYESLKETRGESIQLRRAKAEAHILDCAPLAVHPYELIVGSMTDFSPVNERTLTPEEMHAKAHALMDACRERKRGVQKQKDRSTIKTFETEFTTRKSRWALMSRVYHDASITYAQLQQLIEDTKRDYANAPDLEPYEFGRELERGFKIDYGAEVKAEIDGLPWFAANHLSLNYGRIVRTGFGALIADLEARAQAEPENEYYTAALLVARAASGLVARYAARVHAEMAGADAARRAELQEIAELLDRLATEPAHTFREGVQLMWLLHIMASFLWSSALSFGRFDQYMNELY